MVRVQRAKPTRKPKKTEVYDEDDPEGYKHMPTPDKRSSYTKDKIDEFHEEKIASLLARGVQMDSDEEELDDEEEVMALQDSESEEDEEDEGGTDMESDLEEKDVEDLPNEMAWGKKKKAFYDSDYVTTKGKKPEELEEEEKEEEEEAIKIQKRFTENLSEEDYDLNFFQEFASEEKAEEAATKTEKIVKDLKEVSQKEKIKMLKKESPELLELIQDFKKKLTELKDEIQPLVQMVTDGKIPPGKGADYLKTKQQLYLNYCTNISFYLVLKAKRIPANNHPVIQRLLTYRTLINKLGAVDMRLAPELRKLLVGEKTLSSRTTETKRTRKQMTPDEGTSENMDSDSEMDEEAALQFYKDVEQRMKLKRKGTTTETEELGEHDDYDEDEDEAKRGITYQMAKNKGLTPKRKKIDRNPRVKHREKFRRAKIRRKGQVREVRTEDKRYSGEKSGIRAGVKKSTKLKI